MLWQSPGKRALGPCIAQGMSEYLILVALVAVASIAIVTTLGDTIRVQLGKITSELQGKDHYGGAHFTDVTEEKTKHRSLADFDTGRQR